jgi:hypothetical protein
VKTLKIIWKCIQTREIKNLWWWWWTNLLNLPLFDGDAQFINDNKQMRGRRIAFENPRETNLNNNVIVKRYGKER